jgi:phosphate/sulfate permease
MFADHTTFAYIAGSVALCMLIWDTIEVGRNDAANIINAVFGARVLSRRAAVRLAAIAVIIGATASSAVIETARNGIFDPSMIPLESALAVYIAVYITDTVLLYSFSAFGMPISTTACLVFELLGAGFAMGYMHGGWENAVEIIFWSKSVTVISGIIVSIIISGAGGFLVQRMLRGAIGQNCQDQERVQLHGPWITGAILTGLIYFMLMKGMKNVEFVKYLKNTTLDEYGPVAVLLILWFVLTGVASTIISIHPKKIIPNLFSWLAILGMIAIAVAFGQNDLANCASPGVASWMILKHGEIGQQLPVSHWLLFGCGLLLSIGMMSKTAQRVTRAQVNTGSQGDVVRLYAPQWTIKISKWIYRNPTSEQVLAPKPSFTPNHKLQHYDALRAAVITSISASVIAFASGRGLPVSTTYVSFAAIVATGWADRIFLRGDAHLKLGRTIWVVFCWFFSAFAAAAFAGMCAIVIYKMAAWGIGLCLIANFSIRYIMKTRANLQEERLQAEATERKKLVYKDEFQSNDPDADDD